MMEIKRRWGGKVLVSSLFSYIFIIVLPIAAYVLLLGTFSRTITRQADELSQSKLKLLSATIDTKLDTIRQGASETAANEQVVKYIKYHTGGFASKGDEHTAIAAAMSQLLSVTSKDMMIENTFIYCKASESVIADTTKARAWIYYTAYCPNDNISYEGWRQLLHQADSPQYVFVPGKKSAGNIFFLIPMPISSPGDSSPATFVVKLRSNTISRFITDLDIPLNQISIFGENGRLLYPGGAALTPGPDSDEYITNSIYGENGWYFTSYTLKNQYRQNLAALWRDTILLLSVVAVLCLSATAYAVRKNYHPLVELMTLLEKHLKHYRGKNEYDYLKVSINNLLDMQERNSIKLEKQTRELCDMYVTKLLLGNAGFGARLPEYLALLGLSYDSDRYVVMVMDFSLSDEDSADKRDFQLDNKQFGVFSGYSVTIDGKVALLADASGMSGDELPARARELYEVLNQVYDRLVMVVSLACNGEAGIAGAYAKASAVLQNLLVFGGENFAYCGNLSLDSATRCFFTLEDERILLEALTSGDSEGALAAVRYIWAACLRSASFNPGIIKLLYNDLLCALFKATCESSLAAMEDQLFADIAVLEQKKRSVVEMQNGIETIIVRMCAQITEKGESGDHRLYLKILDYIDDHYVDNDLDISKLCYEFACSRTALFRLFKQCGESGVLNSINVTRINAAKRILANGGSISKTATDVGFLNTGSFLRVFKRYEGITPGQYRELQKGDVAQGNKLEISL